MNTRSSFKTMTDAELIDEDLDCDDGSLAHTLADRLDALPIHDGIVHVDDKDCGSCDDLKNEIHHLEYEVSRLENNLEELDIDTLIAGAKRAREAVKQANDKVNYLFGLGGSDE